MFLYSFVEVRGKEGLLKELFWTSSWVQYGIYTKTPKSRVVDTLHVARRDGQKMLMTASKTNEKLIE